MGEKKQFDACKILGKRERRRRRRRRRRGEKIEALPSGTKRFGALNFSSCIVTYSIELAGSVVGLGFLATLSRRVRAVPLSPPFQWPACLPGSSSAAAAAAASLTKRRFSKSPSVLTITDASTRREGRKSRWEIIFPSPPFYLLATLISSLSLYIYIYLSLSFFLAIAPSLTWPLRQRGLEGTLRAWNTIFPDAGFPNFCLKPPTGFRLHPGDFVTVHSGDHL